MRTVMIIIHTPVTRNNFWDEYTTVTLASGGAINGYLYAYEDSIFTITGGELRYISGSPALNTYDNEYVTEVTASFYTVF